MGKRERGCSGKVGIKFQDRIQELPDFTNFEKKGRLQKKQSRGEKEERKLGFDGEYVPCLGRENLNFRRDTATKREES